MKRNLKALADEEYDLLVVGAGIYGACAAWDAALRGLKTAVIDKGDFGSATSQNSLKIIHGGLRYLQQMDIVRMRESIRERRTLMKIAPQFVHPLPCIMPTYGHLGKGREALRAALLLNDLIGYDRNRIADREKHLPPGRIISRRETLELLPGIPEKGLTGGAVWYDCQTHNSERLLLSFLLAASERGARAANYLPARGFVTQGKRVCGAKVRDELTGQEFEIRAKNVLLTAGPWAQKALDLLGSGAPRIKMRLSTAVNLVTRKLIDGYAAGLSGRPELMEGDTLLRKGSRLYFTAPWRSVSLAGTLHNPYYGDPDDYHGTEEETSRLLAEINAAYPPSRLERGDVKCVLHGLLPMKSVNNRTGEATLVKHYSIIDHRAADGWDGLVSVIGVKYTTARDVAERAVDLVLKRSGKKFVRSASSETPVYGGEIEDFDNFVDEAAGTKPRHVSRAGAVHLAFHYGSRYKEILSRAEGNPLLSRPMPGQECVMGAEIVHAVREEMAVKLADVIRRRTELGSAGPPTGECLAACADLMAGELGWDDSRKKAEIEQVLSAYPY